MQEAWQAHGEGRAHVELRLDRDVAAQSRDQALHNVEPQSDAAGDQLAAVAAPAKRLEQVWGLHEDTDTRAIDNFIVRLRRYIEKEPGKPKHLLTVRGVGYRFRARPDK